jgi:protein-disulfide isomerase
MYALKIAIAALVLALPSIAHPTVAHADDGFYPIVGDDGTTVANHPVDTDIESEIDKLQGVVSIGNPRGSVTLREFYDVNCP